MLCRTIKSDMQNWQLIYLLLAIYYHLSNSPSPLPVNDLNWLLSYKNITTNLLYVWSTEAESLSKEIFTTILNKTTMNWMTFSRIRQVNIIYIYIVFNCTTFLETSVVWAVIQLHEVLMFLIVTLLYVLYIKIWINNLIYNICM